MTKLPPPSPPLPAIERLRRALRVALRMANNPKLHADERQEARAIAADVKASLDGLERFRTAKS